MFKNNFEISLPCSRLELQILSEKQLYIKLRRKHLAKVEAKAVVILQKFTRMIINRIWWIGVVSPFFALFLLIFDILKTQHALWIEAARMIQKNFRNYRKWSIVPKVMKMRKINCARTLQKFMRGFVSRKLMYKDMQENKLDSNLHYFDELRERLVYQATRAIKL